MERSEAESLIKQLKASGITDEQVMETFYETFQEGKMDRKDLESLAGLMGYELTDEFKNDPQPDPIASGATPGGEITKEAAENAKEIKPGESPEEFQESISGAEPPKAEEGASEPAEAEPSPEEPKGNEEDDEEKGWEEAQKKLKW